MTHDYRREDVECEPWPTIQDGRWSFGQSNGVKAVHQPTGLTVCGDIHREQHKNHHVALTMLQVGLSEIDL